jgi:histidine ammonia-lyase
MRFPEEPPEAIPSLCTRDGSPRSKHELSLSYYRLDDFRAILEFYPDLELCREIQDRVRRGSEFVLRKAADDRYIYGVNTGFGALCETRVGRSEMRELQRNLILSHAAGVGAIANLDLCRLTLFIKLLTFRSGHTGIRLGTVQRLIDFWNRRIIPGIPLKGTVGASGDLAPLAHMTLPLLGLGCAYLGGKLVDGGRALEEMGWSPLQLHPKEGLALINGVQFIDAIAISCLLRIQELLRYADLIASLSLQAFSTSRTFYQPLYVSTSHHAERLDVAANLCQLLDGSNHFALPTCNQSMQDPYSFRCIPQVHGAVRQTFGFAADVMEKECNGVSDNPLFFPEQDEVLLGGNLHGESTALVLDYLAIAASELASISERRTYQLLSGQRGLPSFLTRHAGLCSGLMLVQYTSAALVNENKVYATPASVDTIPTCQLQEDHVSMGGTAGHKLRQVVANCELVLAIELLASAQAIELNEGLTLSPRTREVWNDFRGFVPFLETDRVVSDDIESAHRYLLERLPKWSKEFGLV